MKPVLALALVLTLGAAGSAAHRSDAASRGTADEQLSIPKLEGSIVRMGSLEGQPLYGVRVRAVVCARSARKADGTYPSWFRVAHYVTRGKAATTWGNPFRVLGNELHWLVPLGETTGGRCTRSVTFEDIIPPDSYGGVESPLGKMGYSRSYRCYGIRLTLRAALERADRPRSTQVSASNRAIVQCGRFRPR